jgi:hypothetical protein
MSVVTSVSLGASRVILVFMVLAPLDVGAQTCQPRASATGKECFVSVTGSDANSGTLARPFRTIAKGVSAVQAGDVLSLLGGVFVESVAIANKHGTALRPIVIRSYPGERAFIDGSLSDFRTLNNEDWVPAGSDDLGVPHADEFVSRTSVTGFVRGAFLDRHPYTRLITYSRLEDLRAPGDTFARLSPDDPLGHDVFDCDTSTACVPAGYRYPWVYMGPGIWVDPDVSPTNPKPVHIRLSHTSNSVPGLADYAGDVDPRRLRLAVAIKPMHALRITDSSHLRFERLGVRFGGDVTVMVRNTTGLLFDHVEVWASSNGIRTGDNDGLTFQHCDFNGGRPSWFFRDDGKRLYWLLDGRTGVAVKNTLGEQTIGSLVIPSRLDFGTTIHHSEFHSGHDLYLGGSNVDFHHNWIHDLNDEGLVLDAYGKQNVLVHHNVISKTLSAFSFASQATGSLNAIGGPFFIYRNLVDLREPIAGYRPSAFNDVDVWRYGSAFKSNGEDGPYAVFQNTFLVWAQTGDASYMHYWNLRGNHLRRAFNNIFVAIDPDPAANRPITMVPSPLFPAQTDGNVYYRIAQSSTKLFKNLPYSSQQQSGPEGAFDCLYGCYKALIGSRLFEHSRRQYAPGFEANSIDGDPKFRRLGADGVFRKTDDLRIQSLSPALNAGIALPDDLACKDDPPHCGAPPVGAPDIGSYRGAEPHRVGIDGRRSYPVRP